MASGDALKKATYDDLCKVAKHQVAEIIGGTLYVSPRPTNRHAQTASVIGEELGPPFKRGKGGPGGWLILDEPELHLGADPDIVVPDLAGWRRSTMPEMPLEANFKIAPDWTCEVLSPSTRRLDRVQKLPLYAVHKVQHVWLVDPEPKTIEVYWLDGESYRLTVTFAGDEPQAIEPFDAISFDMAALWMR